MSLRRRRTSRAGKGETEARVAAARRGDAEVRETLIHDYQPLILKVAARASGRYLQPGRDEEVSVALLAFNEAIDRYDSGAGTAFVSFAEMVIRRRLIDYFRREAARPETPMSEFEQEDDEGEVWSGVEQRGALDAHRAGIEAEDRRQEVLRYREVLAVYGLRLEQLVELTPRHEDARERAIAVARAVGRTPAWQEYLRRTKTLPLKEMEQDGGLGVSRKTLERQRKYIIAVALLFMEDLGVLRSYVPGAGG